MRKRETVACAIGPWLAMFEVSKELPFKVEKIGRGSLLHRFSCPPDDCLGEGAEPNGITL